MICSVLNKEKGAVGLPRDYGEVLWMKTYNDFPGSKSFLELLDKNTNNVVLFQTFSKAQRCAIRLGMTLLPKKL